MPAKQFSKVGKNVGDLFKKEYDFQYQVATKSKSGSVNVETGAYGKSGGLNGYGKLCYKDSSFGSVDLEMRTNDKPDKTNIKLTLDKLGDGLEVVVQGNSGSNGSLEASYAQDFFSTNAVLRTDGSSHNLSAAGLITSDGLSVGGQVNLNLADGPELTDYNVGAEYSEKDITLTLLTKKQGEEIHASYYQKTSSTTTLGCTFTHNPDGDARSLTFGGQHQLDSNTTLKSKASTNGTVSVAVQHRLANPAMLIGVASSFNALSKDPLVAQQFGVSLKFGDF
jgi:voltage-dependent anion channel protein 2